MHKFTRNFLTEWRKLELPFENETFIVGVSGGADSVSLLLVLQELRAAQKLKLNFICGHFNHGLRGAESDADAAFVENLAKRLGVEFVVGAPKSKIQHQKGNLEQAARLARYEFLLRVAEVYNASGILTAHTINDQAETFLLNLIRGSGPAGLGAIRTVRKADENSNILLIRPLLNWARRETTENFVRERETGFREDSMNDDEKYSRVRVRKKLIPLLSEFNPKIVETLARTAQLLREAEADRLPVPGGQFSASLRLAELKTLSKAVLYRVLREWLGRHRGNLRRVEMKHVEAIESLIFSRKSGRRAELPGGEIIIKKQGRLFFEKTKVEKSRFDN